MPILKSGGGGTGLPVDDATAIVKGSGDATKLVRIEADGITTATTRVITMPDEDIDLDNVCPAPDTTAVVKDPGDATKLVRIDAGGITTGNTRVIIMANSDVVLHKNNLASATDPAPTDDLDGDYTVGSVWINTTAGRTWTCVDNTDDAAVWHLTAGGRSSFGVHKGNTDQTGIVSGVITKITWSNIRYITIPGEFASDKFTVTIPGTYAFCGQLRAGANFTAGNENRVQLFKNGGGVYRDFLIVTATGQFDAPRFSWQLNAVAGDYFEVHFYHNKGTDGTIDGFTSDTWWAGALL